MGILRKLLCVQGSGRAGSRSQSIGNEVGPARAAQKSLKPGTKGVILKQQEWMQSEKDGLHKLHQHEVKDVEKRFRELTAKFHKGVPGEQVLTKEEMRAVFKEMNINMEPEIFDKIVSLIDADGDGRIDLDEFSVATSFLMLRGSAKDRVELAFRVFDDNGDQAISRREFNQLIAAVIGNRVKNLLTIERGREAFEEYLKSEYADELLRFIDAIDYLSPDEERPPTMARDLAEALFDKYIEEGAPDQVNVSARVRETIRTDMQAVPEGDDEMPLSIFAEAADEALTLIESGPLARFKAKLRSTYSLFADKAWEEMALDADEGMSLEVFRTWSSKTPGIFIFFDQLHEALENSTIDWGTKGAPPRRYTNE